MSTTSRRGFLKGLGATLAVVGAATATTTVAAPAQHDGEPALSAAAGLAPATQLQRSGRQMITADALAILVVEQLNERIACHHTFTAYDVTRSLRAAHPAVHIMHADVRMVVHRRMQSVVAARFYHQVMTPFPTGPACCYIPQSGGSA